MSRVLLLEDDELVGTMVRMNLENAGHELCWCRDGADGLAAALETPFDLVLLDISLPGQDGYQVLEGLRARGIGVPVLMLTARSDVSSKVKALVRRSTAERQLPASRVIRFDRYRLDLDSREAETNEGTVVIGEKEAEILALLVKADGAVLSRADIIEEVWGLDAFPVERTVDNYLVRLRALHVLPICLPRRRILEIPCSPSTVPAACAPAR
jgi:two-component system OmpR family response regulator